MVKTIPELITDYITYSNPYKISHAHGVIIEQSGVYKSTKASSAKKATLTSKIEYPHIEFYQELSHFGKSIQLGIESENCFYKEKKFGFNSLSLDHSNELFRNHIIYYLSTLPWMPWTFGADHIILQELEPNIIEVCLAHYPEIKGVFVFSDERKIHSFHSSYNSLTSPKEDWTDWLAVYGKYNIKKTYKVPTDVKYSKLNDAGDEFMYLHLEKIVGYTVL
ncbi:MAG: DUF6544 family protein [Salibacteraceae bacterium]